MLWNRVSIIEVCIMVLVHYINVLSLEERTKESNVLKGNFCPTGGGSKPLTFFHCMHCPACGGTQFSLKMQLLLLKTFYQIACFYYLGLLLLQVILTSRARKDRLHFGSWHINTLCCYELKFLESLALNPNVLLSFHYCQT